MPVLTDHALPTRARLVHAWLPVVLALLIALAAGWAIMHLNAMSYQASQDSESAKALAGDLQGPAELLAEGSRRQLASPVALPRDATAPSNIVVYYSETLRRLQRLRGSTGEAGLVDDVSQALLVMAATQDRLSAGGSASLVAARDGARVGTTLTVALSVLDARLQERSSVQARLARGGTMVIALLAALGVIVMLRRFDRVRQRLTSELHAQATHDPLTGLANRRQLARDLARTLREATVAQPSRLVFFDLDGFKAYNDTFGHPGGDRLLGRLGEALTTAIGPSGSCYRLGGDEFCVLLPDGTDEEAVSRGVEALSEVGSGFHVTCSHGSVLLPTEASECEHAMRLADERMYLDKSTGRASAGQQAHDLAIRLLGAQEPEVERHSAQVAILAVEVGRGLGLSQVELTDLVRAAELHDIGKVAIPVPVLHKAGALDASEWTLLRRHPAIGADILASAPALQAVADIVRHSHERFDGSGYPAGLAGRDIPLASRIVAVCDAFDAMVSDRPYRAAMSDEMALHELEVGSGSQFDPTVLAVFGRERRAHRRYDLASARAA